MNAALDIPLTVQVGRLLLLAVPVACVAWTVTHERVFEEFHEWCVARSESSRTWRARKFFYLFTCEYCFSHYVAALALAATGFRLLQSGWTGVVIAWFSLVWIANVYMSLYVRLRLDIKRERVEVTQQEVEVAQQVREQEREQAREQAQEQAQEQPAHERRPQQAEGRRAS